MAKHRAAALPLRRIAIHSAAATTIVAFTVEHVTGIDARFVAAAVAFPITIAFTQAWRK